MIYEAVFSDSKKPKNFHFKDSKLNYGNGVYELVDYEHLETVFY